MQNRDLLKAQLRVMVEGIGLPETLRLLSEIAEAKQVPQASQPHRKKGAKQGRKHVLFNEPKTARHFNLTPTAITWMDELAQQHQCGRNALVELWARNQLTIPAPQANAKAIAAIKINPRSSRKDRISYAFGEAKGVGNMPLTDTAMKWLQTIADAKKTTPSDVINLWVIGALPLPPEITQPEG